MSDQLLSVITSVEVKHIVAGTEKNWVLAGDNTGMNDLLDHHEAIDQDTSSPPLVDGKPAVADDELSLASEQRSIGREVHSFIKHIDSLADTLPLAMLAIQGARGEAVNAIEEFTRDHCEVKDLSEGRFRFAVPASIMGSATLGLSRRTQRRGR